MGAASGEGARGPSSRGLLLALTGLAAVLRLYGLGQQSLWSDEMHTVMMAGVPYGSDSPPWRPADLREVTQGPLFMGLVHAWSLIAGRSETALRLVPALFAIATVPIFFRLAERLIGRGGAFLATLVLVFSPFHIWYAQELRGYSLVMWAAVASALALASLLADRGGSVRAHLGYAASVLTGLGGSLTMGFLLPVHGLLAAVRAQRLGRRRILGLGLTWILIGLVVLPWLGVFGTRHDLGRAVDRPATAEPPLRGETTMPVLAIPYTFYAFAVGFSFGPTPAELRAGPGAAARHHLPAIAAAGCVFGGLAVLGLSALLRQRRRVVWIVLLWIGIPFLIAGWMAVTNVKVWNARYVAVAWPAFLLLIGAGLCALSARLRPLGIGLVLALSVVAIWNLRADPRYGKEDYRSAGAYLDLELAPGDLLIGIGAPQPIFYYAQERPAYLLLHPHRIGDEGELRRRIAAAAAGRPRVWLFRVRAHQSDPEDQVGRILAETRTRAVRAEFSGIEIQRFDRAEGPAAPGEPPAASGQSGRLFATLHVRPLDPTSESAPGRPLPCPPTAPNRSL
jgi:4-amino-4-deoxy-L-arabinose transferase-like glycosyltransferase